MGNNSGFKVDEPALGQWVRVLRKGRQNRKDILKNAILSEATKKSSFSSGQIPGAVSLTVANAASQKPESLCPGFRDPLFQEAVVKTLFFQQVCSLERMLRVKTRTEEGCSEAGEASGVSDDRLSSQSHSIRHLSHDVDSSVVNSVSVSPVSGPLSPSAAAASSPAGLPAACGVAAVGSVGSVEGGGACVVGGCASRVACVGGRPAWGGVERWALVLVFHLCSQCMCGMMQIRVWTR